MRTSSLLLSLSPVRSALTAFVFVLASSLLVPDAEAARRLGGGKSVGQQSTNVTQREAARPANAAPQPAGTAPTAAAAPKRPWGAMLGGLAAGLGLAWLAHTLGFGETFANVLLALLLAFVIMAAIGVFLRRRAQGAGMPFAMQGAGAPAVPRAYSPANVGNDSSARPWERGHSSFDAGPAGAGSLIGSALGGSQGWGIPSGFDVPGFVSAAKRNFVTLQEAWDRADLSTLRSMMTDSMLTEIRTQLAEREQHQGSQPNRTEVVMLDAQLLGIEDLEHAYMASVEFAGMIREEPSAGPSPFREVWNMTKPKDGSSGWLVAGVQALQ